MGQLHRQLDHHFVFYWNLCFSLANRRHPSLFGVCRYFFRLAAKYMFEKRAKKNLVMPIVVFARRSISPKLEKRQKLLKRNTDQ